MSKRAAKPGAEWAVQSGRLLSLSAGLERQMKDMLALQNSRAATGAKGGQREILAGLAYGELRMAAEKMNSAFHRIDQVRALEEAEHTGEGLKRVNAALIRAFGGQNCG